MELDTALKIAAGALSAVGIFSLWRPHREQVLSAKLTLIREAWPELALFRLKVRHWADGLAKPDEFFKDVSPVFEATITAFHRAQLVLDPDTVDKLEQIFDDYALMRAHLGNAAMCIDAARAAPGAYADRAQDHRAKWREAADKLDRTMDEVHRSFQCYLHGSLRTWWWDKKRAAINVARRPWLKARRRNAAAVTATNAASTGDLATGAAVAERVVT